MSLNHKSIIAACKEVYEEYARMSDIEFHARIKKRELDTLGSLLYETDTVVGCDDVGYTNAVVVKNDVSVHCGNKEYNWITVKNTSSYECSDNYYGFNEDGVWKKAA